MEQMEQWPEILKTLAGQMTKSTFDTLLNGTTASVDGDILTVHVKNGYAKDWVEKRLQKPIIRTVAAFTSQTYTIAAQVGGNGNGNGAKPAPLKVEPGQFATELVYTDPRQQTITTSVYAIRFWQPVLTPPVFGLWITLRGFAWDGPGKEVYPSIQLLADICAGGNRHKVIGRAERKDRKAFDGYLKLLQKFQIVSVRTEGRNHERAYFFRVLEHLPILTPVQASWLPDNVEEAHKRWLRRHQLGHEQWKQLTMSRT